MKNIWIIPDRHQNGLTYAIDAETIAPLTELVNVKRIPPELVIGIPEEILRKNSDIGFLYAQCAKLLTDSNQAEGYAFCISTPAGTDRSGRIVCITNLQILDSAESPTLPPERPSGFPHDLIIWTEGFDDIQSGTYRPVFQMLEARCKRSSLRSFSSERLRNSRFTPDWMPQKKSTKFTRVIVVATILSLLILWIIFLFHQNTLR